MDSYQYLYHSKLVLSQSPERSEGAAEGWDGQVWTGPDRITDDVGFSGWPAVAVDSGDNLHVVWGRRRVETQSGAEDIYYSTSPDSGLSWSKPVKISGTVGGSRPRIAVSEGNRIHVVWYNGEIFYASSQSAAPYIPPKPLLPSPTPTPAPTATSPSKALASPTPLALGVTTPISGAADAKQKEWFPLLVGLAPVIALLALVIVGRFVVAGNRRW